MRFTVAVVCLLLGAIAAPARAQEGLKAIEPAPGRLRGATELRGTQKLDEKEQAYLIKSLRWVWETIDEADEAQAKEWYDAYQRLLRKLGVSRGGIITEDFTPEPDAAIGIVVSPHGGSEIGKRTAARTTPNKRGPRKPPKGRRERRYDGKGSNVIILLDNWFRLVLSGDVIWDPNNRLNPKSPIVPKDPPPPTPPHEVMEILSAATLMHEQNHCYDAWHIVPLPSNPTPCQLKADLKQTIELKEAHVDVYKDERKLLSAIEQSLAYYLQYSNWDTETQKAADKAMDSAQDKITERIDRLQKEILDLQILKNSINC